MCISIFESDELCFLYLAMFFFTIENADPDENAPLDMYVHCLHWPLLLIWHLKLLFIEGTENSFTGTYSICILYVPIISLVNCSFHSFAFGNHIL